MVGSVPGCCARAAIGQAAAPLIAEMNCRLPMPIAICPIPMGRHDGVKNITP